MIYTCTVDTPLGAMTAAAEDGALTGLWFTGQKYYPPAGGWTPKPDYPAFEALRKWLEVYFSGRAPPPWKNRRLPASGPDAGAGKLRLNPRGTDFQKAVWEILLAIPYGELSTYGAIAKELAAARGVDSMSARAAGGAAGRNPISILIPCHRVVGSTGGLTGYAGGLDKKRALLRLEGRYS
ncbi:MAG: methylated-DNA--[protein]-cysteine S-methyltransferase [Treponema sp.]|jgi:methylated-DNA-[protein]-cysteine S-methyltransferase|nr:methylated-DNA--[protein]-cysteine S-methyltransferase [Treponema sp.]